RPAAEHQHRQLPQEDGAGAEKAEAPRRPRVAGGSPRAGGEIMTPAEFQQRLTAYFHGRGHPAGEPLEEDLEPLVALLRALSDFPQIPAGSQTLVERLVLEQLPWAEGELSPPELERLQGVL